LLDTRGVSFLANQLLLKSHQHFDPDHQSTVVALIHQTDTDERVLAERVEFADSVLSRARGLMFRRSFPEGNALVFEFGSVSARTLHMLFVPFPIDAVFLEDEQVTHVSRLRSWIGLARGSGDVICELPAGSADGVEAGDTVRVVRDS